MIIIAIGTMPVTIGDETHEVPYADWILEPGDAGWYLGIDPRDPQID